MRVIFIILGLVGFMGLNGQSLMSPSMMSNPLFGPMPRYIPAADSNSLSKKWSLNKYVGISSSFGFFNGGNTSVISAPIGFQLNRRLNQNLYAFAGLSVAPSYFTYSRSFNDFNLYKSNPGNTRPGMNNFGIYSRAEAGLMYVNDERTFSISGSIGIQNSSYPLYPANRNNTQRQAPVAGSRL